MNEHNIEKHNYGDLANIWIHAYWWVAKESEIIKFGKIMLNYFQKAIENNQIPLDHHYNTVYLMGEIHLRIGEQEKAIELFDPIIFETQGKEELKKLRELAIQQKLNPNEIL